MTFGRGPGIGASFTKFLEDTLDVQYADRIPNYVAESCERSVQMRLYTMGKQEIGMVLVILGLTLGLCITVGLVGPPAIRSLEHSSAADPVWNGSKKWAFLLHTPPISNYGQQLWIEAQVILKEQRPGFAQQRRISTTASLRGTNGHGRDEGEGTLVASLNKTWEKLTCIGPNCYPLVLIHLPSITYSHYQFSIKFSGVDDLTPQLEDIVFYFKSYNPEFTKLEMAYRFMWVIVVFVGALWYLQALSGFAFHYWSLEQRLVAFLLPLQLGYNNPLFPLLLLSQGWIPRAVDAIAQTAFLAGLLLFWLAYFHGLREPNRSCCPFYCPKILLVALIWLLGLWPALWDGSLPAMTHSMGYQALIAVLCAVYFLWLVFLLLKAIAELRNLPFYDVRMGLSGCLMLLGLAGLVGEGLRHWGLRSALASHSSALDFTAYSAMLNLYGLALAWLHSPNPNLPPGLFNAEHPGTTLMQDEEDEDQLIYASSHIADGGEYRDEP